MGDGMISKKILPAVLGTAILAGAAVAGAQGTGMQGSSTQTSPGPGERQVTVEQGSSIPPGQLSQLTLTVENVDRATNTVTFKAHVDPSASVIENGQPTRLSQLEPGDSVRASFDPNTGEVQKLVVTEKSSEPSGSMGGSQGSMGGSSSGSSGSSDSGM